MILIAYNHFSLLQIASLPLDTAGRIHCYFEGPRRENAGRSQRAETKIQSTASSTAMRSIIVRLLQIMGLWMVHE